jgi:hypothetical protein
MATICLHASVSHLRAYQPAVQDGGDSPPKEQEQNIRCLLQKIEQSVEILGKAAVYLESGDKALSKSIERIDRIDTRLSPTVHRSFVRFNSMFLSNLHWKMITVYIVVTLTQTVRHVTPAMLRPHSHKRATASTGVTTFLGHKATAIWNKWKRLCTWPAQRGD